MDDIIQRSEQWFTEKLGKPGSSKMDRIITPSGKESKQKDGYLWELAAERVSGLATSSYQSQAMLDGIENEHKGRLLYELLFDVEVEQVGMIYQDENKRFLCSPDGIINREYGLEMKNVLPKTQVGYLLSGKLPGEYFVQIQTSLLITGFSKWVFMSVADGLPPLIIDIPRDYDFTARLKIVLDEFCDELDATTEKLRALV